MPNIHDMVRQQILQQAKSRGVKLTNGMSFGQYGVYNADSDSIIDAPNAADPAQRQNWAKTQIDQVQSSIDRQQQLAEQYRDPNSAVNQKFKGYFDKMFASAAPTSNSLMGAMVAGGLGTQSGNFLAQQKAVDYGQKAQEASSDFFNRFLMQQQGFGADYEKIGQGYAGMQLNARTQQDELALKKWSQEKESSDSFWNQTFGLGGGLLGKFLTGGFL